MNLWPQETKFKCFVEVVELLHLKKLQTQTLLSVAFSTRNLWPGSLILSYESLSESQLFKLPSKALPLSCLLPAVIHESSHPSASPAPSPCAE